MPTIELIYDTDCPNGVCADDCAVDICVGSLNANAPCNSDDDCACDSLPGIPVVAGLPIEPLFPVNFGAAPCTSGTPPEPQTEVTKVCIGGGNDGTLCSSSGECPSGICTTDGVFVDRTGVIWAAEGYADNGSNSQWCVGGSREGLTCTVDDDCVVVPGDLAAVCRGAGAAIRLFENWPFDGDLGCQPWRGYVCVGDGGTIDTSHPLLKAGLQQADHTKPLPYDYAFVRAIAPRYYRLPSEQEQTLGTDPLSADSDGDSLDDGAEIELNSDPLDPDTDDDGTGDGDEVAIGRNPTINEPAVVIIIIQTILGAGP